MDAWRGFKEGNWKDNIDVTEFIRLNYTEYLGDDSFLEGPTEATTKLVEKFNDLMRQERLAGGTLDLDTSIPSTILSHGPGYIEKDLEAREFFNRMLKIERSAKGFYYAEVIFLIINTMLYVYF